MQNTINVSRYDNLLFRSHLHLYIYISRLLKFFHAFLITTDDIKAHIYAISNRPKVVVLEIKCAIMQYNFQCNDLHVIMYI